MEDLMMKLKQLVKLLIDNKSAINLAKNLVAHGFHYLIDRMTN